MNERERLIELLNYVADNLMDFPTEGFINALADHLIAHGVVVQKQGEWEEKEHGEFYSCSCCNYTTDFRLANYCPNCGAEMRR